MGVIMLGMYTLLLGMCIILAKVGWCYLKGGCFCCQLLRVYCLLWTFAMSKFVICWVVASCFAIYKEWWGML